MEVSYTFDSSTDLFTIVFSKSATQKVVPLFTDSSLSTVTALCDDNLRIAAITFPAASQQLACSLSGGDDRPPFCFSHVYEEKSDLLTVYLVDPSILPGPFHTSVLSTYSENFVFDVTKDGQVLVIDIICSSKYFCRQTFDSADEADFFISQYFGVVSNRQAIRGDPLRIRSFVERNVPPQSRNNVLRASCGPRFVLFPQGRTVFVAGQESVIVYHVI